MYSVFRRAALTYVLHRCFDRQRPGLVFGDFNFRTDACSLLSVRLYSHHITSHHIADASPHRQLARTLIYYCALLSLLWLYRCAILINGNYDTSTYVQYLRELPLAASN